MAFRLTPRAEADIEEIALSIAEDSPSAALRWTDDSLERCRRLGDMPGRGVARPEVRPDLLTFPVRSYLILYRVAEDQVADVVSVVHGARQWQDLLD